jgi:hypothetical protein
MASWREIRIVFEMPCAVCDKGLSGHSFLRHKSHRKLRTCGRGLLCLISDQMYVGQQAALPDTGSQSGGLGRALRRCAIHSLTDIVRVQSGTSEQRIATKKASFKHKVSHSMSRRCTTLNVGAIGTHGVEECMYCSIRRKQARIFDSQRSQ